MIVKEFEGKNEEEAINSAIEALGLEREDIDVEILESKKASFLFGGGKVKIRVHMDDTEYQEKLKPENDFEKYIIVFIDGLLQKTGLSAEVMLSFREAGKIGINIETEESGILIGKRGQTLEAVQLITNIVAGRREDKSRVIIDTQNYRMRRENNLVRFAQQEAEQVRMTRKSKLLEAMNPFERRLIHSALSTIENIETNSEGEGLYKRIRIYYRGDN